MILIFSTSLELSTNEIQCWLNYFGEKYIRINSENYNLIEIDNIVNPYHLIVNEKEIKIDNIKSVWIRKWDKSNYLHSHHLKGKEELYMRSNLIEDEFVGFSKYLFHILSEKDGILDGYYLGYSKLIQLYEASKVGLKTPLSYIVNRKTSLRTTIPCITKPIEKVSPFLETRFYTSELTDEFINSLEMNFFPSLIQEKVDKLFEIRSFYIDEKIYSMAILSQLDEQTKVDFRNYNNEKPNRCIPYKLSDQIELKITELMKTLKIKCGSIDIIKTKKGEFVFLEVNPNGQFGMVSSNCNYYLEYEISKYLCKRK